MCGEPARDARSVPAKAVSWVGLAFGALGGRTMLAVRVDDRIVANLLDNAERYTIAGGTVEISTTTDNCASLVRVVITGRVVPPATLSREHTSGPPSCGRSGEITHKQQRGPSQAALPRPPKGEHRAGA